MIDWKSLPSLSSLRAFDAVARAGSFTGAAKGLNVTHAAISQQVRGLERDLGVSLAQRAGRQVALTETGRALAYGLEDGFAAIAQAVREIRDSEAARPLRVSTTPFIVDAIVMPRLSEFWEAHPGVEIGLQPSVDMIDLAKDGFDLAIRAAPAGTSWPGLEVIELAESNWIAVAAPKLAETGRNPVDLPWVWTNPMPGVLAALRQAGVDIDGLAKVEVGSPFLHWQAVRRGLGVGLASEHVARDDIEAGRLVALPMPCLPRDGRYFAAMPKGNQRPIVLEFARWLRTIF